MGLGHDWVSFSRLLFWKYCVVFWAVSIFLCSGRFGLNCVVPLFFCSPKMPSPESNPIPTKMKKSKILDMIGCPSLGYFFGNIVWSFGLYQYFCVVVAKD